MRLARQLERSFLRQATALLFVLLMVGFGFVQAVHVHDVLGGQTSSPASHCSLCVVAHNTAIVAPTVLATGLVSAGHVPAVVQTPMLADFDEPSTFIRPPPQVL